MIAWYYILRNLVKRGHGVARTLHTQSSSLKHTRTITELPLYFTRHALNRMRCDREPPRIRLLGSLPDGRRVRVVAVEEGTGVVIVTIVDEER